MDVTITGTVVDVLEEKSGESANGPWRKQDFILETEGQYPRKVCITQWGEKIEEFDVEEGETLTAHVDIESREYEGRWYTDVKAWKVERAGGSGAERSEGDAPAAGGDEVWDGSEEDAVPDDDLPF